MRCVPTPRTPTSTLRRREKSGATLSRPLVVIAPAVQLEKKGAACAAPVAGDRRGDGVPWSEARREPGRTGECSPELERVDDDERPVPGRAGDPGVLEWRPGVIVMVLWAMDPRFWLLDANGETKVIGGAGPPGTPVAGPGLASPPVGTLDDGEASPDVAAATRARDERRRVAGMGSDEEPAEMAVVARPGVADGGANGLVKNDICPVLSRTLSHGGKRGGRRRRRRWLDRAGGLGGGERGEGGRDGVGCRWSGALDATLRGSTGAQSSTLP